MLKVDHSLVGAGVCVCLTCWMRESVGSCCCVLIERVCGKWGLFVPYKAARRCIGCAVRHASDVVMTHDESCAHHT
jgi:hypothetical protein